MRFSSVSAAGLLGLISALLLVACGPSRQPLPELPSFQPALTVKEIWAVNAGEGGAEKSVLLSPVVTGNSIVTADYEGQVAAMDLTSGKRAWVTHTGNAYSSNLSTGAGKVFIGTTNAEVVAIDSQSGKIAWQAEVPNQVFAAPAPGKDILVVKSIDGQLDALNIETGQLIWSYNNNDPSLVLRGGSAAQVVDDKVIVGFGNGKVLALESSTGELIWEKTVAQASGASPLERMVDIDITPLIKDNVIYVATYQGKVEALGLQTGQVLWSKDISAYSGMLLDGDNLIISDANGEIWAFRVSDGTVIWRQDGLKKRVLSAPVIQEHTVAISDKEGFIHWLSREDGTFLARTKVTKYPLLANPVVANGTLFVESTIGDLYAYRISKLAAPVEASTAKPKAEGESSMNASVEAANPGDAAA